MELLSHPGFYITYALIQAVALVVVVRLIDRYDRQPLGVVVVAALWGATGAALISLVGNSAVQNLLPDETRVVFGDAISAPIVEELAKGLAIVAIAAASWWVAARFRTPAFAGVTDGLLYGVAVGLGFAFTEDFFYFLNRAETQGLEEGFQLFLARRDFFGPQALHHPLFTAPFGVALGLAMWTRSRRWRVSLPLIGLGTAMLIHAVNNGLVEAILMVRYGVDQTTAYINRLPVEPPVLATATQVNQILRGVDTGYLVIATFALVAWQRYQRRVVYAELAGEVTTGLITPSDRDAVVRFVRRWRTYVYLLRRRDFDGWRRLRAYHQTVAKLGFVKWRVNRFGHDQTEVRDFRRRLAALRAVTAPPGNVPLTLTSLVGRNHDLDVVSGSLENHDVRLITVTGDRGVGKSSFAIAVAARCAALKSGGAYYVAALYPAELPGAVARVLDLKEMPGSPLVERLAAQVLDKDVLLVLDTLIRDDDALREVVAAILAAAPKAQIVASCGTTLGLAGEREHHLLPLSIAGAKRGRRGLEAGGESALTLFTIRALAARRTFVVDETNAEDVAEVCSLVGGSPVCIELVAGWVKFLGVDQIAGGLRDRLTIVTGGAEATAADRLTATLDWVHDLLDETQRQLFEELSVFPDGCTIEGVERVCPASPNAPWDEVETVISLVERNVLRQVEQLDGRVRFEMVPVVRAYAAKRRADRCAEDGFADAAQLERRFVRFCADWAEGALADLDLRHPTDWKARVDREHDNLVSAIDWAHANGEPEVALRLAIAMARYWELGFLSEGVRWLDAVLDPAMDAEVAPEILARGANAAGTLTLLQGDIDAASRQFSEAVTLGRQVADDALLLRALLGDGWAALLRGDYGRAVSRFEEALTFARRLGDELSLANAATWLGRALTEQQHTDRARELLERGLRLRRFLDDDYAEADSVAALGRLSLVEGRYDQAILDLQRAIELTRQLSDRLAVIDVPRMRVLAAADLEGDVVAISLDVGQRLRTAEALQSLALVFVDQHETAQALPLLGDRLAICNWLGDRLGIVETSEALAVVCSQLDPPRAAELLGFATLARIGMGVPPWDADHDRLERAAKLVREALPEAALARAWERGEARSIERAVAYASETITTLLQPA